MRVEGPAITNGNASQLRLRHRLHHRLQPRVALDDAEVRGARQDRELRLASGSFEDDFTDGNAVHIYRIDGSACWLPAS